MSGGTLNLNLNLGGGGGGKKIGENKVARAVAFKVKKKEGKKKGRKIFVHNVSEKATYVDFQASVVKFGKVTGQSEYSRIIHSIFIMFLQISPTRAGDLPSWSTALTRRLRLASLP